MSAEKNHQSIAGTPSPIAPGLSDDDEMTELVFLPRRRSRMVLVFAALAGAGTVVAVALFLLGLQSSRHAKEDALTLYQVAQELHRAGDSSSALEYLGKARAVAKTPRAVRQIDELARQIRLEPALARAQALIDARSYRQARAQLATVLERDPRNEKASLMMRLLSLTEAAARQKLAVGQPESARRER